MLRKLGPLVWLFLNKIYEVIEKKAFIINLFQSYMVFIYLKLYETDFFQNSQKFGQKL